MSIDTVSERVAGKHRPAGFVKTGNDLLLGKLPVYPQGHLTVETNSQPPDSSTVVL